jgi:hypothetical protein
MVPPKAVSSGIPGCRMEGGGNLALLVYHAARLVGVDNKFCVTRGARRQIWILHEGPD